MPIIYFSRRGDKSGINSIQDEPMSKQKSSLNEAYENWRGDLEQIDDVCVIGVRI